VKVAGLGGIIGVDTTVALRRMLRADIQRDIAEDLLAACERGFVAAMNEKDEEDSGHQD
jgi:hypothetical protein